MAREYQQEIEFFRDAYILVPRKAVERYETVLIPSGGKRKPRLFCNCSVGKEPTCGHTKQLVKLYTSSLAETGAKKLDEHFNRSVFRQIFSSISRVSSDAVTQLTTESFRGTSRYLTIYSGKKPVVCYHSEGEDRARMISRIEPQRKFSRAWLLERSTTFVESEYERAMRISGHKTVRMLEESSLWYRLAYHCFQEFRDDELQWRLSIDGEDGIVILHMERDALPLLSVMLPPKAVSGVIDVFKKLGISSPQWESVECETELLFRIEFKETGDVLVTPVIDAPSTSGDRRFNEIHPRFCYGSLVYLPETGRFRRFSAHSLQRVATGWNQQKTVSVNEFSSFMTDNQAALSMGFQKDGGMDGSLQTDLFGVQEFDDLRRIVHPPLIRAFDHIELHPKTVKGSQWTIEIIHRTGDIRIHLAQLLGAQQRKEHYCLMEHCLVDMRSTAVTGALAQVRGIGADGVLSLSSMSLMLLRGSSVALQFDGDEKLTKRIKKMFSGKPRREVVVPPSVLCTLRNYQINGVAWMLFLYDYYLGGLLCDEMGLGKTIQLLTLITIVREQHNGVTACIVCPTSVISHWNALITRFTPSLRVVDYTKERKLPVKSSYDVIVLSYGIMRNDVDMFERRNFDLIVFDEIQQLKNRDTAGYRAACRLRGRMVIGLTGTPVENSAEDLQSLFNLVLPGLTIDIPSERALLQAVDSQVDTDEITRFKRRIEPFVLRRCKAEVLDELPQKIEEHRICTLSPYQYELYREAIDKRAKPLIEELARSDTPIPYMHIFSLMTFLKKLCNTPALASGCWRDYTLFESGKWELFKELLDESLGSGEKVVVFTQFLDMVEIFKHYLLSIKVDFEVLTGSSTNRDRIIKRFTEDSDCKVFIGSLKAGGVGIDLIAASVVIHYDRWWNAAREDQATDRVHRFGQTRGVQVFKLITENTLEERIDRIIARKKELARIALTEDSPDSVKHFTRDELIEMLSVSSTGG